MIILMSKRVTLDCHVLVLFRGANPVSSWGGGGGGGDNWSNFYQNL